MNHSFVFLLAVASTLLLQSNVHAQKSPEAGYVFPAGGKAGTTIDVKLGGYDWTPDMEYVVHDPRIKLTVSGPPGPVLLPPPPYWFGAKGRLVSMPLAREVSAKYVIPAGFPSGPVYWQAANANGATEARVFIVGDGPEVIEDENRKSAQLLVSLPITISGRLFKNEEVDQYRFVAAKDGPISCEVTARRIGSKFVGILQVHDAKGQMIKDALGTVGADPSLTFAAKAGTEYVVSLNDIDFGGDRSYVYRLAVTPGPRVVGAVPAAGMRGQTREFEFVLDTGDVKLQSIKANVLLNSTGDRMSYWLKTPLGVAPRIELLLSHHAEVVAGSARQVGPIGITGVLDQPDVDQRHSFDWKKDDVWSIALQAQRIGSPLDVAVTILGPDCKELAKNDDLPGTTDAGLDFTVPADGTYTVVVNDTVGKSGTRDAIYRLAVTRPSRDFTLELAVQRARVPVGEKFDLTVSALRTGGFKGPIALNVRNLPAGFSVPPDLVIPGERPAIVIPLQSAKDAGTLASLISIAGSADVTHRGPGLFGRSGPPQTFVSRNAQARTSVNLTPSSPEQGLVPSLMLATTLKPVFKGQPVDQDTGRKVHRGSTHPAEVIVERLNGFQGDINLQQSATQSYQMQGITGGEVTIPPGVGKILYPVFMPEWLETTRTSRCGIIGVAKVADPKGKVRYTCESITGYVTMTMEGALLKVSADDADMTVPAGQQFDVRLKIARLTKLNEAVKLELVVPSELVGQLKADSMIIPIKQDQVVLKVTPNASLKGLHIFTIRGTAMQESKWLVMSEAALTVEFAPSVQTPKK